MRHSWGRGPGAGGPDPGLGRAAREREDGRDGDGKGLVFYLAVGQRLLQVGDARGGDVVANEVEHLQVGHPLEVHQPRVRDLGAL